MIHFLSSLISCRVILLALQYYEYAWMVHKGSCLIRQKKMHAKSFKMYINYPIKLFKIGKKMDYNHKM